MTAKLYVDGWFALQVSAPKSHSPEIGQFREVIWFVAFEQLQVWTRSGAHKMNSED